jgi:hypothetical protein
MINLSNKKLSMLVEALDDYCDRLGLDAIANRKEDAGYDRKTIEKMDEAENLKHELKVVIMYGEDSGT